METLPGVVHVHNLWAEHMTREALLVALSRATSSALLRVPPDPMPDMRAAMGHVVPEKPVREVPIVVHIDSILKAVLVTASSIPFKPVMQGTMDQPELPGRILTRATPLPLRHAHRSVI